MGIECLYIRAEFIQQSFSRLGKQKRRVSIKQQKIRFTIGRIIRTVIVH